MLLLDEGDPNAAQKVFILSNKCMEFQKNKGRFNLKTFFLSSYDKFIVIEQEKADKSKVNENKLKEKIFDLEKAFENEREKLFKITNEMNKQYKQMQDEILKDINQLKADVKKKTEQIGRD